MLLKYNLKSEINVMGEETTILLDHLLVKSVFSDVAFLEYQRQVLMPS